MIMRNMCLSGSNRSSFAGEAAMRYSVLGCCEVDKHSSGLLLSRKTLLDVLCQQGDLVWCIFRVMIAVTGVAGRMSQ